MPLLFFIISTDVVVQLVVESGYQLCVLIVLWQQLYILSFFNFLPPVSFVGFCILVPVGRFWCSVFPMVGSVTVP